MKNKKVKFLIIRLSSIGDIVLTTPVIRCLKQQVDGCEIHFLVKEQYAVLVATNPYIDKIHIYSNKNETAKDLALEFFDHIIDLHNNLRTRQIKTKLKVPDFTVNKLNWQKFLLTNFKINKLPHQHIVDRYLETVKVFDVKNDEQGLDYFPSPEAESELNTYTKNIVTPYICLAIGGQHFTKKMPTEMLALLCSSIHYPIVLLGGKEDSSSGEIISQKNENKQIYNLCGKISLDASALMIRDSKLVITHDTGLMHIAAAYKKIVFSIWGNTVPDFGMVPYQTSLKSTIFEVNNLKCRPCSKIGFEKCPKKHFNCMMHQDIGAIATEANKLVSGE
jgi:heptosyltransferase-2